MYFRIENLFIYVYKSSIVLQTTTVPWFTRSFTMHVHELIVWGKLISQLHLLLSHRKSTWYTFTHASDIIHIIQNLMLLNGRSQIAIEIK